MLNIRLMLLAIFMLLPLAHVAVASEAPELCAQMGRIHKVADKHLWLPQRDEFYTAEAANRFANNRTVVLFRGTKPYSVPKQIDWSADPFDHTTWRLFFNALSWLYAPLHSYSQDGNIQAGREAKSALFNWIGSHIDATPDRRAIEWNDQAAAYRLANFGEFGRLLNELLTTDERYLLKRAIEQHATYLKSLFSHPAYYGNNHGFMDAMAIYSAGVELDHRIWVQEGRERIDDLFHEMFVQGVSIEQSFGYQTYKLRLMHEANCFAIMNAHAPIDAFERVAREALEFISLVAYPDMTLPAIGDTYFRMPIGSIRRYLNENTTTPVTRFIWSDGRSGQAPPLVNVRPLGGYGVFWPSKDTRLVFDFTGAANGHNHNDGLNFTLFANGKELIVDSAGPYSYGSEGRKTYFIASVAHNVILVNDRDGSGPAELTGYGSEPFPWMRGETDIGDVRHARTIILKNEATVEIEDQIQSESVNSYALLFHLPPSAIIEHSESTKVSVGEARFSITVERSGEPIRPDVEQGWVTHYTNDKEPSPFLRYEFEGKSSAITTRIYIGE